MPIKLETNFFVPNPLCGDFTTVFSQVSGPGSGNLASLMQDAYDVTITTFSASEPTFAEGVYQIQVSLSLNDHPVTET